MKRFILFLAAAVMVSTVLAGFKYEGEWGELGSGNGQFNEPSDVDVAPNGNVYVADNQNGRFQYFTADGSFLGKWSQEPAATAALAIAPNGNVYTGGCSYPWCGYPYFTQSGSLIGSFGCAVGQEPIGYGDIAPNGDCYACETNFMSEPLYIAHYTSTGSLVGSWYLQFGWVSAGIGVASNQTVYVGLSAQILRYTSTGSLLGSWGSLGSGNGQFRGESNVDVGPDGRVFVTDSGNNRVQYFTATGSFLGKWGTRGTGAGEFNNPVAISVSPDGKRVYVADTGNNRIQYFVEDTSITPTSLGKVKALFR